MVRAGHQVTVAGLGESDGEVHSQGVRVVTLARSRLRRGHGVVDRWRLYRWLRREVREGRTGIIETPEFEGLLPAPFSGCPVVVRLHQSARAIAASVGRAAPASLQWYEDRTLRQHRHWIGVSRFALRMTEQTFGSRPLRECVIYPPVTLEPVDPTVSPLPADYLLYAGTVAPYKGVCVLAESARRVLAEFPATHLVFAGRIPRDGGDIARTIRNLAGPGAAERIHFTGHLDRGTLAAYMRNARAFAFPSALETFGLVTAEAMLAGTPVVVADCGPNPEFIRQGENGLLVPPNSPAALADAIGLLLRCPEMAARLARNGQRTVEREFSIARCVRNTEAYYSDALDDATDHETGAADDVSAAVPFASRAVPRKHAIQPAGTPRRA
jgi:glycosyltransferase involved in cell wall biosynthesis